MSDVLVIGGGPAGVVAAMRAGDLGARTALVTQGEFGGMAANDGPIPVRTLAQGQRSRNAHADGAAVRRRSGDGRTRSASITDEVISACCEANPIWFGVL